MVIITDSIRAFLSTKQNDSEAIQDYTRRFKISKEIMESHIGGPIILSKYIELTEEFKDDVQSHQNDVENGVIASQYPNHFEKEIFEKGSFKILRVHMLGKYQ